MIFCLGSINVDYAYSVPHFPQPGETLTAKSLTRNLGGKGANQSVAAARAGARVCHIGAIGSDGDWMKAALGDYGVDTQYVVTTDAPTGHAVINVDDGGENVIVIYTGANQNQSLTNLKAALENASSSDTLLIQNETDLQAEAASIARTKGMRVIYSAAPFSEEAVSTIAPYVSILVTNALEADQLTFSPECTHIITRGAEGAEWCDEVSFHVDAIDVTPVDTTGAGDCFTGTLAAALDEGLSPQDAMRLASAAAALQIQSRGAAPAMPARAQTDALLTHRTLW